MKEAVGSSKSPQPPVMAGIIRFGTFEVDRRAGELRRGGIKLKLSGQPFDVLVALVEKPGQVVTREELHDKLWSQNTFVDFEQGLNKVVNKVREALGDDADNPRFIETLPRRGYRFLAPVTKPEETAVTVVEDSNVARVAAGTSAAAIQSKGRHAVWALALAAVGVIAVVTILAALPPRTPSVLHYTQLTHDGQQKTLAATDGSRLYMYIEGSDYHGMAEMSASGGEPKKLSILSSPYMFPIAMSPDGSEILVTDGHGIPPNGPLWSVPVLGGSPRRLADHAGIAAGCSPDGKLLAYSSGDDLFVAHADGTGPRKLVTIESPEEIRDLVWSPDGSHLRFSKVNFSSQASSLWEISVEGTGLHPLFPGWHDPPRECCGNWTADGHFFLFSSAGQIWALPRKHAWFQSQVTPIQLTSSPMSLSNPIPSKDGKRIFAVGATTRGELMRYDSKSGRFVPFLGGISAEYLDFSKDRQWIAYVSYPEGTLWRSKVDGSERLQLTYSSDYSFMPRWSPDGKEIVFFRL